MGNRLFTNHTFTSFEDGWEFIYENIKEEYEEDGTYDDYYVIEIWAEQLNKFTENQEHLTDLAEMVDLVRIAEVIVYTSITKR